MAHEIPYEDATFIPWYECHSIWTFDILQGLDQLVSRDAVNVNFNVNIIMKADQKYVIYPSMCISLD